MDFNRILNLIMQYIPKLINFVIGKYDKKTAGKKKFKLSKSEYNYLCYLVDIRYSQVRSDKTIIDEYSKRAGVGLATYVKEAMNKVKKNPDLIESKSIRNKFLKQQPSRCARGLCNTIARYIWMELSGVDLPSFPDYYINCVNSKYIKGGSNGDFCWLMTSDPDNGLIIDFMRGAKYWQVKHDSKLTNSNQMIEAFEGQNVKLSLVRKGNSEKSTHTYLVGRYESKLNDGSKLVRNVMFDTHHHKYTGKNIITRHPKPDKLYYIYGY